MKGIINLNKPKGWTSRDAVNKVRNTLHVKEIGHMGTLDPQGEGVLLIGVGKATRLFDALLNKDKVYRADFTFGYETDTLDGDGSTLKRCEIIPTPEQIMSALPEHIGDIMQLPPMYSAKNVNGVRAYDLARKGIAVELKPSPIKIYSIRLVEQKSDATFTFEIHCSAGTYIRSICRDLAYSLGTLATMTAITRLRAGEFSIESSITIDELIIQGENAVIPLEKALECFPRYDVSIEHYKKLANGVKIPLDADIDAPFAVYCNNELFGLGEKTNGFLKVKTYLKD